MSGHIPLEKALALIIGERYRQDEKWGQQHHSLGIWYAILGEEFGEVGKEICEHDAWMRDHAARFGTPFTSPEETQRRAREGSPHLKRLQKELTHLVAVGVQMLEALERDENVPLPYPKPGTRVRVIGPSWDGDLGWVEEEGLVVDEPDTDGDFRVLFVIDEGHEEYDRFPLNSLEVLS